MASLNPPTTHGCADHYLKSASQPVKEFLEILNDPVDANLDIVFIHGLDPLNTLDHATKTWTAEGGIMWPRDLLPTKLPRARILLFGYNANVAFDPSTQGIRDHASSLLARMNLKRQALMIARDTKRYTPIRNATWGLVFFGTPHHGGNLVSLGSFVATAVRSISGASKNSILKTLEKDGYMAEELLQDFRAEVERYQILSFFETKGMKLLKRDLGLIVEKTSAVFNLSLDREEILGLNANHSDLCKFHSREAENYEMVEGMICERAKGAVLAAEEATRQAARRRIAVDQIQISIINVKDITDVVQTAVKPIIDRLIEDANQHENENTLRRNHQIRNWLSVSSPNPSLNYDKARAKCHPTIKTGLWFLESQAFLNWKESSKSWLWLYGIPGCGKTVLNSHIKSSLDEGKVCDRQAVLYYYFDFSDDANRTAERMIMSFIEQLDDPLQEVSPALHELFVLTKEGQRQPNWTQMLSALRSMLQEFDENFILLDALEECRDIKLLLDFIRSVKSWNLENLHFLITSRKEEPIEKGLMRVITTEAMIHIQEDNVDKDIRLLIQAELEDGRLENWAGNATALELIEEYLISKACGMFRLVDCQLDILNDECSSVADLRRALPALPPTLDDTYYRILSSIRGAKRNKAYRILRWLAYSRRQLLETEVLDVLTIQGNEDVDDKLHFDIEERPEKTENIIGICSSLITSIYDTKTNTNYFKLAHLTVQEYLESGRIAVGPGPEWPYGICPISSNMAIARVCLGYLFQFDRDPLLEDTTKNRPLARYAAEYWTSHARAASKDAELLNRQMEYLFLEKHNVLINWIRLFNPDIPREKSRITKSRDEISTPLYYAALSGLNIPVSKLIKVGAQIDAPGGFAGNALQAACSAKFEDTVNLLLDLQANVNARVRNVNALGIYDNEHDALHVAAYAGNSRIVERLLDAGANVNSQGSLFDNALEAASYQGHDDTVELLLNRGADIEKVGGRFDTALIAASWSGLDRIVKILLRRGANPNTNAPKFGTALQATSNERENSPIIDMLLAAGADVHAVAGGPQWFGTALQAAAASNYAGNVQKLIDKGADVNQRAGKYETALQAAAAKGGLESAKLLLQNGADIKIEGGFHRNAMKAAKDQKRWATLHFLTNWERENT
ncbi:hypothetical protein VE04_01766 [Pseudogymnoascus sp. 24MN13]|nr:hypothetical protein VE04_01766 [Pseudogymnoascus sp. 24MN13]